jgi:hypothetical protein
MVRPQILAGELGSIVVDVQTTVRVIILPRCGGMRFDRLTVASCCW